MNTRLVENKGLQKELRNGIDGKPLPLVATTDMTVGERIAAAVNKGYEVLPKDVQYYYDLTDAFGLVANPVFQQNENNSTNLIRRLRNRFGTQYNPYKMLEDITLVFGDYVEVNKKLRRHIQRGRYEMLLRKAQKQDDLNAEITIMKNLDKLDSLDTENDKAEFDRKPMRGRKRSTNPEVFKTQK